MKRRTAVMTLASATGGIAIAGVSALWLTERSGVPAPAAEPGPQPVASGFGPEALATGPSAVVLGNPQGDVTVVEFFDYQCPYCRRVHPDVEALVAEDRNLRLVHKHWPVIGAASTYAARLALAARWQEGRYVPLHDALMRLPGRLDEARLRDAARGAGVDMAVLGHDLEIRKAEIEAALGEATVQARLLRLQGTPAFVIGNYLVPGALDRATMRRVVADVRGSG